MANISELSVLLKANTKQAQGQMQGFGKSVGETFNKMKVGILAVGGVISAFAIASVKEFIEVGDMLGKMASRTKISVEVLDDLRIALDLSGTSIQGFEKGMRTLVMRVDDARKGNVEFIETFGKLGLSVEDFAGLNPDELFMRVAGGLAGVTDTLDQQAIAVDLLGGKFGTSLLPALENGEQGFRDLLVEAGAMSNWTDAESQMAEDLADDITELNEQMNDFQRELASNVVPALIDVVSGTNDLIDVAKDGGVVWSDFAKVFTSEGAVRVAIEKFVKFLEEEKIAEKLEILPEIDVDAEVERFKRLQTEIRKVNSDFLSGISSIGNETDATTMLIDDMGDSIVASGGFLEGLEHVISDIDEAQDQLDDAMKKTKDAVDEQIVSVILATESWIDYHKAIGLFQSPDAVAGGGSIYDEFPSMMSPQGQSELFKGVLGLPSVGGDPNKAHAWLNSGKNPFNAGGFNAFNFPTNQGSSNVVLTNIAQINAGINDAKMQGSQ